MCIRDSTKINEYFHNLKFNDESINFSLKIIKFMGGVNILKSYREDGDFEVGFDLTVIDENNSKIKCVEVKNTDNFTESQVSSMWRLISSKFVDTELCLVRPKLL